MHEAISRRFCGCIKKVRRTVKARKGTAEQAAIAICVKSVLHSKGKTIHKFSCKNGPRVQIKNRVNRKQ